MQVGKNKVVSLSYVLTLNSGEIADTATADSPFTFIHGIGQTLDAFDSNLEGLAVGDEFSFLVEAANGYGIANPDYVAPLPRHVFDQPGVPSDILQVGNIVPLQDQDGNHLQGRIVSFDDNVVNVDFNHPMAGEDLNFTGTIIAIREATPEELDHGHVHGPGGHHH